MITRRTPPWGTIAAVGVVSLFAAAIFGYAFVQNAVRADKQAALVPFIPSASLQDPSTQIPGVVVTTYQGGNHVQAPARVAYDISPPAGGPHDQYWAACNGVVYPAAVRNENMVHSLEHGAAWITYDPARISGDAIEALRTRAADQPYTIMSPYPGLDSPISLQSWGHQLKLDQPDDARIDQFLQALRSNRYTDPESGASCRALNPAQFDQNNPPPWDPTPPPAAQKINPAPPLPAQPPDAEPTTGS